MVGKNWESIPEGEMKRKPLVFVSTQQRLPLHHKHYRHTTIETASIQENFHPSLRKGNGMMLCRTCLGALEYAFSRKRGRRYTAEEGPAVETSIVAVCRCPEDGSYSTVYESDIVRNKQYCLGDIQSVLENKADYCLASPRTRSYWRSWLRTMWASVVEKIHRYIGRSLSECDISCSLAAFLKGCGDQWLRYVLDLFYTQSNNLCILVELVGPTIGPRGEQLQTALAEEAAEQQKPPRGG